MQPGKTITPGLLFILGCLIPLLLIGCNSPFSRGSQAGTSASQQVYRYGAVTLDISSFDPAQASDQTSQEAVSMVFTGLVQLDDNSQIQPQLAQSYDVSSDGLTYTFHLRPGLTFSDGTPLDASAVAYSIDRALSPALVQLNGVTLTYLGRLKGAPERASGKLASLLGSGIKVLDKQTIQLTTSTPSAYFLKALTSPTAYVVEKKVIDQWGTHWTDHLNDNGGQGGAGPFVVQSYNHNTGIVFRPNRAYYGLHPRLQKVVFDFYPSAASAFQAYQNDQEDLIKAIPSEQLTTAINLPDHQYRQTPALAIDYIAMNYLYKPFNNLHIREAFALAINKDMIADRYFKGSHISTCHIIPSGMAGYNPALHCPEGVTTAGDPAKARALFQQGLQEEKLTQAKFPMLKITYTNNVPALNDEITALRQQWQQVLGVRVQADVVDFETLLTEENATSCDGGQLVKCQDQGLEMWAASWSADYPDPQDWISLQFSQNAPNNQENFGQNLSPAAFDQQRLQEQMLQADIEQNQHTRLTLYNQIEQQLVNSVAWIPLAQRSNVSLLKPYVVGKVFNAQGLTPPDDWSRISITAH